MKDLLQYRNYFGSIHIDQENNILYGKLEFIRALVTYEADNAADMVQAFHEAVDDYLKMCLDEGIEPEKPCKGSFNIRVGHDRHLEAVLAARALNKSLNDYVCYVLDNFKNTSLDKASVYRENRQG